jgi:hypothetical protein
MNMIEELKVNEKNRNSRILNDLTESGEKAFVFTKMRFRILGATFLIAVTTSVATGEVLVTDSTEKETLAVIRSVPVHFHKD